MTLQKHRRRQSKGTLFSRLQDARRKLSPIKLTDIAQESKQTQVCNFTPPLYSDAMH